MRERLVDATLICLERHGYAGTTISRIIEIAGVSRGAPVHHFNSKDSIIEAAAETLIKRIYIRLGEALETLEESDDRLADLIRVTWREIYNKPETIALNELLQASQRDKDLAKILQQLWSMGYVTVGTAANHYFEPVSENVDVGQMMLLTQWFLSGMAADRHLVVDPDLHDHYLSLWSNLLSQQIRARENVTQPPPRPPYFR